MKRPAELEAACVERAVREHARSLVPALPVMKRSSFKPQQSEQIVAQCGIHLRTSDEARFFPHSEP